MRNATKFFRLLSEMYQKNEVITMFSKEEKAALTERFWTTFKYKSKQKFGKRHSWVLQNTGIKGIQLKFEQSRSMALVVLQCHSPSAEKREWIYDILQQYHRVVADVATESPIWDKKANLPELGGMPSVYYKLEDVDYLQEKHWETIHEFFIQHMKQLEEAFLEIKDVLKAEIKELQ